MSWLSTLQSAACHIAFTHTCCCGPHLARPLVIRWRGEGRGGGHCWPRGAAGTGLGVTGEGASSALSGQKGVWTTVRSAPGLGPLERLPPEQSSPKTRKVRSLPSCRHRPAPLGRPGEKRQFGQCGPKGARPPPRPLLRGASASYLLCRTPNQHPACWWQASEQVEEGGKWSE